MAEKVLLKPILAKTEKARALAGIKQK